MKDMAKIVSVLVCLAGAVSAQLPRQMNLYLSDGSADSMQLVATDSIRFENDSFVVYTVLSGTLRWALARVDSVTFPPVGGTALVMLEPAHERTVSIGDTLTVSWRINPAVITQGIYLKVSPDDGENWFALTSQTYPYPGPVYSLTTGTLVLTIPATITNGGEDVSLVSNVCRIMIVEYNNDGDPERTVISPRLTITERP